MFGREVSHRNKMNIMIEFNFIIYLNELLKINEKFTARLVTNSFLMASHGFCNKRHSDFIYSGIR